MAQNRFGSRAVFNSLPVEVESPTRPDDDEPVYDTTSMSSFFEPPRLHNKHRTYLISTESDSLGDTEDCSSSSEETLEDFAEYRALPVAEVLNRRKRTFSIAPSNPCTASETATPCSKGAPLTDFDLRKKLAVVEAKPLPKRPVNPSVQALDAFLHCFEELRFKGPHDEFDERGRFCMTKTILQFTAQNKPIEMILPAFPCKSPSSKKVLGTLPDYGEHIAFKRLQAFCNAVESVYAPGCRMVIMGDGRVFADLIGVDDAVVDEYIAFTKTHLLSMCPNLEWSDLDELLPANCPNDTRAAMMRQYGTTTEEMRAEIRANRELAFTYAGFSRFLASDRDWAAEGVSSKSQVKKRCQEIAREMMCRNRAFSKLIEERYSTHLRLSIHGHSNAGPKFGIRLTADMPDCVTPWHNCVVIFRNSERILMHRSTAEKLEYVALCHLDGKPWFYHELSPEQMETVQGSPGCVPCEVCNQVSSITGHQLTFWPIERA